MSRNPAAEQAPTLTGVGALPAASPSIHALAASNTELEIAVRVAQRMLVAYGDSSADGFNYPQAYGALSESLRILLRALGAEPSEENSSVPEQQPAPRCPAAHPEDPDPCRGPIVVTILDTFNAGADGCEHHAVRLLASLAGGRPVAKPDAPASIALRIFRDAHRAQPYPWRTGGGERP